MVFKRRDPRTWPQVIFEFIYPRGGWGRAFHYVRHRVRRLPDSPERIARGIFAGVFAAFTPFYGLHFVVAALVARLMNGNILAALAGTFFGNPLTYIPIGVVSLQFGHFLLGSRFEGEVESSLARLFFGAGRDLVDNFIALFTDADADWSNLAQFYHDVYLPYLVGGILPGIVAGSVCYYLSLPVVAAYQKRRRARLKRKLDGLRSKSGQDADDPGAGERAPRS